MKFYFTERFANLTNGLIITACWRGIGVIPQSGLKIREKYAVHDAEKLFDIQIPDAKTPQGCACGEILIGTKTPPECEAYSTGV